MCTNLSKVESSHTYIFLVSVYLDAHLVESHIVEDLKDMPFNFLYLKDEEIKSRIFIDCKPISIIIPPPPPPVTMI